MNYTKEQYSALQALFDYFNKHLFDNQLDYVVFNFARKKNMAGYFAPDHWQETDKAIGEKQGRKAHEIALNPDILQREPIYYCQTLVHEQCHLWQHTLGKNKPAKAYHNKEWAAKMEEVGLMPSDTGRPGGKKTGMRMSDYVIEGGKFERKFKQLPEYMLLPLTGVIYGQKKKDKPKDKVKYTCPSCEINAWGKPELALLCGDCETPLQMEMK